MKIYNTVLLYFLISVSTIFGQQSNTYLFLGSYTDGEIGNGILVYQFDTLSGKLTEVERVGGLVNSSFLTLSPNGKYLYACTDTRLKTHGSVTSFEIDSLSGKLTLLNKQTTKARNPVHVTVSKNNKHVIVSNYTDASISFFECNEDGSLQPISQFLEFEGSSKIKGRQDEAHLHSSTFSPDGLFVFSPDLGSDKIRVMKYENSLIEIDKFTVNTEQGAGPRHFVFHPYLKLAYCIDELSGEVSQYAYKEGELKNIKKYKSYKKNHKEYASADIHISPDGRFLYASNRIAENSLSIFEIDQENGELLIKGHQSTLGKIPRSFVIDPTGNFLIVANKESNNLIVFRRNNINGQLLKVSEVKGLNSPSSLKMRKYSR